MIGISRLIDPFREEVVGENFLVGPSKLSLSYILMRCRNFPVTRVVPRNRLSSLEGCRSFFILYINLL